MPTGELCRDGRPQETEKPPRRAEEKAQSGIVAVPSDAVCCKKHFHSCWRIKDDRIMEL